MPTPAEKRALVFLSAVLSLGAGVRATKALSAEPPPPSAAARADLHRQIVAVDSADSVERISGGKKHWSKRPVRVGISTTDGSDASVRPDSGHSGQASKERREDSRRSGSSAAGSRCITRRPSGRRPSSGVGDPLTSQGRTRACAPDSGESRFTRAVRLASMSCGA